jgi:hypothetical protein
MHTHNVLRSKALPKSWMLTAPPCYTGWRSSGRSLKCECIAIVLNVSFFLFCQPKTACVSYCIALYKVLSSLYCAYAFLWSKQVVDDLLNVQLDVLVRSVFWKECAPCKYTVSYLPKEAQAHCCYYHMNVMASRKLFLVHHLATRYPKPPRLLEQLCSTDSPCCSNVFCSALPGSLSWKGFSKFYGFSFCQ